MTDAAACAIFTLTDLHLDSLYLIVVAPGITLFALLQRLYLKGLTEGAVKRNEYLLFFSSSPRLRVEILWM